jgi:high-affinity iron transporter
MGSATEEQKTGVKGEVDFIRAILQTMLAQYKDGNYQAAFTSARTAYLDSYEHVEIPLRTIDPDFTLEVELQFAELRNLINQRADYDKVEEATIAVRRSLDESERLVTGTGHLAPTIAFTSSFAVVFREGLESVLILGAIITYLEASRNTRFKPYVYYGILIAIGATAVTWFAASFLIKISGANRELIEAIAALSATAVLFYVSFWILNKIEHKKWMEFVKAKVWQASATGGTIVFVMLSFFTVYREGFETVLFYEAMFGFAKYMETYVAIGFVAGLGTLLGVYYVTRKIGKRLPLKMLFALTMGVGAYLSIAFLGNAVRELQTLDIIPYTSLLGIIPRLDINMAKMTGIYPTLETLVAQVLLLGIYLVAALFVLVIKPRKEEKIATMRKSRREVGEFETH